MLLTYNRLEYARRTLWSTLTNLCYAGTTERYPRGDLHVHIASDGDTSEYIDELCSVARNFVYDGNITWSNAERAGYGGNYNLATQVIHNFSDYVLPLEDDWELTKAFDVQPILSLLDSGKANCVRLGYIGYTQPLKGEFIYHNGLNWLLLDEDSPEPHVFAGHPRIETVEFERAVGEWPIGLDPGSTEFAVAHILQARQGIVWPCDLVKPSGDLFAHIGTQRSY